MLGCVCCGRGVARVGWLGGRAVRGFSTQVNVRSLGHPKSGSQDASSAPFTRPYLPTVDFQLPRPWAEERLVRHTAAQVVCHSQ